MPCTSSVELASSLRLRIHRLRIVRAKCDLLVDKRIHSYIILMQIGPPSIRLAAAYNQPQLAPCASWNANATTFTNYTVSTLSSAAVFVNPNNTANVNGSNLTQAVLWTESSLVPTRNISNSFMQPKGLFITNTSDVYVANGGSDGRIDSWTWIGKMDNFATNSNETCFSLVADLNNNLYCSFSSSHKVIKRSLSMSSNVTTMVAGTGSAGSNSLMLNSSRGIFITTNFSLYVADCGNNRVQLFPAGQLNGTTVAGNGASGTITLNCPVAITLDGYGYLYIVDQNNHRVAGASSTGFRCVVGCSRQNGSAPFQLQFPRSLAFDANGNLMVGDWGNGRIQEFVLSSNSCGK